MIFLHFFIVFLPSISQSAPEPNGGISRGLKAPASDRCSAQASDRLGPTGSVTSILPKAMCRSRMVTTASDFQVFRNHACSPAVIASMTDASTRYACQISSPHMP